MGDFIVQTYKATPNCTFDLMVTIINDFSKKVVSRKDLKEVLLKEYTKLFNKESEEYILNILRDQNKKIL